jgi:hypothetical protein
VRGSAAGMGGGAAEKGGGSGHAAGGGAGTACGGTRGARVGEGARCRAAALTPRREGPRPDPRDPHMPPRG